VSDAEENGETAAAGDGRDGTQALGGGAAEEEEGRQISARAGARARACAVVVSATASDGRDGAEAMGRGAEEASAAAEQD
jgi:hypothetical protein